MPALTHALTAAFIVLGLLALTYLSTPGASRARLQRGHARQLRRMHVAVPTQPVEYAAHVR